MNRVTADRKLFVGFEKAPAGFLDQAIGLINKSPTLQKEIFRFQVQGGVIHYDKDILFAQDSVERGQIRIPYPSEAGVVGEQLPNPFSGELSSLSPMDWFVGNLSHEMGHALNSNLANIQNTPDRAAQNIAISLLSEGKAEYNRIQVSKEISDATHGVEFLPIETGQDPTITYRLAREASSGQVSPSRAIADLAAAMATGSSGNGTTRYVERYGSYYARNAKSPQNYKDVVSARVKTDAAGNAVSFTLFHSNGSQTVIDLPDYGPLSRVGSSGAVRSFERFGSFVDGRFLLNLTSFGSGMGGDPRTGDTFSRSEPHLDWAALDRAARLIAKVSAAPVRCRKGEATENVVEAGGGNAAASGMSAGYLDRPQGLSPGSAVGPIGGRMHGAAGYGAGGTKSEGALQRSRGAGARPQAATRAAVKVAAAQMTPQAHTDMQAGAELDLASFAALGGPSHLDVAAASGAGQATLTARAPALGLPDWVAGIGAGAGPETATAADGSYAPAWAAPMWMQAGPGLAHPAADGSYSPAWTAPMWMRSGPGLTHPVGGEAVGEISAWLAPTQGSPAAPRGGPASAPGIAGAEQNWPSPFEQVRARLSPPWTGPSATDAWPGAAGMPGAAGPGDAETGFPGFGASEGASRRALDEMARLASRPPVGITGFDAGQMPAWLGGWTGGM